jgi:uncharacterized protein
MDEMEILLQRWQPRVLAMAEAAAGDEDGAHDRNHLQRVWRNARQLLAAHPAANQLVVLAACYLHDLVNLPKNHPERHLASRQAAVLARQQLADAGFPSELLDGVAHAIETHSFSAALTPHTIEAQIVQDADRLDALGAVGLARMFYTAGRMGCALAHPHDPLAAQRARDDKAYSLDHIDVKLATLPASMQTPTARALGQQRLQALIDFRDSFVAEWAAA